MEKKDIKMRKEEREENHETTGKGKEDMRGRGRENGWKWKG